MSRHRSLRTPVALGGALVLVATLGACGIEVPRPTPPTVAPAAPSQTVDPAPVELQADVLGVPVDLSIGPLAIDGDLGVLRVGAHTTGEGNVRVREAFTNVSVSDESAFDGLRLVDLEGGTVREAAYTAEGEVVGSVGDNDIIENGREPVLGYVAFDAPDTPTTDVLVPHVGLVEDVPVVDAAKVPDLTVPVADLTAEAPGDLRVPTAFIETYIAQDEGSVRTRRSAETVTLDISSDVLFDVDSAELSDEADEAFWDVDFQLINASSGELRVIGHTDDVGSEEDNQELSEARAQAVADRMDVLIDDLDRFDVVVEGRGESDPLTTEETDEARALNRRVTIELTGQGTDVVQESVTQETGEDGLPVAEGPVVEGLGGETVEHLDDLGQKQTLGVALLRVHRVGSYLVGDLEVTNEGEKPVYSTEVLSSIQDARGNTSGDWRGANNVTLLDGSLRTYPVDYLGEPGLYTFDGRNALVDQSVGSLEPGQSSRQSVVWPDTGTDTVTVDVPYGSTEYVTGSSPVRWVDVPVED
ncbi:OmpA family protein [Cellulosimicrobium arenosum]|uniref:OmpA family protein n=1 Tax=Cellulosimicrobium arenosum TaxID=2708133 RepID=A0A927G8J0_9MICO|nr:OmpA family protein [Cellulosimicrobium arenosum]MBD8078285.1 OmpA family protein [Cellulosimicrobium arenosum]